jgi:hypothetical protein
VVPNLVAVQVDHREAPVVVAPHQLAIFEAKCGKTGGIKPYPNVWMKGVGEEELEVYRLFNVGVARNGAKQREMPHSINTAESSQAMSATSAQFSIKMPRP